MSIRGDLEKILKELIDSAGGDIVGSAFLRTDGLMIASILPAGIDERRAAALGAMLAGVAERICKDLNRGKTGKVMIEGSEGSMIAMPVGGNILLIALTSQKPNLGLAFLEMERAAESANNVVSKRKR